MKPTGSVWSRLKTGRLTSLGAVIIIIAIVWATTTWIDRAQVGARMHALGLSGDVDELSLPYNYIRIGWLDLASLHLQEMAKKQSESAEIRLLLAMVSEVNNQTEVARHTYEDLLDMPDLDSDVRGAVYALMGRSTLKDSDISLAKQYFARAIEENEQMATAQSGLGIVLAHEGEFEEAISHFETAHELAPEWLEPIIWMASLHNERGRSHNAVAILIRNNELGARDHTFHYQLAFAYENLYHLALNDELVEAHFELIETLRIESDDLPETLRKLGLAAADRGLQLSPDDINLLAIINRLE